MEQLAKNGVLNLRALNGAFVTKIDGKTCTKRGIKYSRQFALNKEALKVDYNPSQTPAEPDDTTTTDPSTPASGDDPNAGND